MTERLTNYLIVNEVIKDEGKEIYYYGFHQGFLILVNINTVIEIGILFKMIWQATLFMYSYIPLRIYGGGYHTKIEARCYLVSLEIIVVLLGIKLIPLNNLVILSSLGVGGSNTWLLAPVEDANKPLNKIEIRVYRKRARIILMVETGVVLLAVLLKFREVASVISIATLVLSIMLVLGIRKEKCCI